MLFRVYLSICERWGPDGLTLSAYAWKLSASGSSFWMDRIDGAFLLLLGQRDHCRAQYERETKKPTR